MIRLTDSAIMALMNSYVPYLAEDFATETLSHLSGSFSIDKDYLRDKVSEKINNSLENVSLNLDNPSPETRFLCKCATYALENNIPNAESRQVYDDIKNIPSQYHDYFTTQAYNAADLYQGTIDATVLGVIVKEANEVSALVSEQAKDRIQQTNSGGNVKYFSWGILSDGIWLNKALVSSFEEAKIFRPGADAKPEWIRESFAQARRNTYLPSLSRDELSIAKESFDVIMSKANDLLVNQPLSDNANTLKDLLFKNDALGYSLDQYEKGLRHPSEMIKAVGDLSSYIRLISHLRDVMNQDEGLSIPNSLTDRLDTIEKFATLALVGFEAARETRFADSLILHVDAPSDDPTVDVYVNKDVVGDYTGEGGNERDLVLIGSYLDPRNGRVTPRDGYSKSWISERKDTMISETNRLEEDRLRRLRSNDANVIRQLVEVNLNNIAMSYSEAVGRSELRRSDVKQIERISRDVISEGATESFSLVTETTKLLCSIIEDDFVSRSVNTFIELSNSGDELTRNNAKALTVVNMAVDDILSVFRK